jgi:putative membrane protein
MYGIGRFGWNAMHAAPWFAWIGPVAMIAFWALFVAAMVMLIVHLARNRRALSLGSSAISILKERYARGEISKEEFEQKKRDLA